MGNPIVTQINSIPKVKHGEIYRHFTGGLYKVTSIASDFITHVSTIVLQELQGAFEEYTVPICMFSERVDKNKYQYCDQEFIFERVQLQVSSEPTYDDKIIIMKMVSMQHPVYVGEITKELDKFLTSGYLTRVQNKIILPTIIPNRTPNDLNLLQLRFRGVLIGNIKVNSELVIEDIITFPRHYGKLYTDMAATCLDKFIGHTLKFIN